MRRKGMKITTGLTLACLALGCASPNLVPKESYPVEMTKCPLHGRKLEKGTLIARESRDGQIFCTTNEYAICPRCETALSPPRPRGNQATTKNITPLPSLSPNQN